MTMHHTLTSLTRRRPARPAAMLAGLALLLGAAGNAAAVPFPGPLDLTQANPDLTVGGLSIVQIADDTWTASGGGGVANFTDAGGTSDPILYSSYELSLNLSGVGALGTLSVLDAGGTLLAGDLTDWGASDDGGGNGTFEFLFDITGTSLPGFGDFGGIIIAASGLPGGFNDSSVSYVDVSGASDNFSAAVPEPGVLALLALGGVGMVLVRRRASSA